MIIIQNALKSITRSKARNMLIGLIIISVTAASVIALTIEKSATDIIDLQRNQFNIQGSIILDRNLLRSSFGGSNENMRALIATVPPLTETELIKYGESDFVRALTFNLTLEMNSTTAIPVGADEIVTTKESGSGTGTQRGQFSLVGIKDPAAYEPFLSGDYKMLEGDAMSLMTSHDSLLINEELAIMNAIGIGDQIELINPLDPASTMLFIITGIYSDESEANATSTSWFSKSANQVIGNYDFVFSAYESSLETLETALSGTYAHIFYLKDYTSVESFDAELKSSGLNAYYVLRTNISELDKVMQPLENLNNFTGMFFVLVLVVGGAILLVINMINIRERKYEIGVLRAIGMKKGSVAMQFLTELTIVTLIAMVVGIGFGQSLSEPIGNHLLKNEIEQSILKQEAIAANLGSGTGSNSGFGSGSGSRNAVSFSSDETLTYVDALNTKLDHLVIIQLMMIGLSIVLVGSLISLVTISRYEPLKILSTRS